MFKTCVFLFARFVSGAKVWCLVLNDALFGFERLSAGFGLGFARAVCDARLFSRDCEHVLNRVLWFCSSFAHVLPLTG